MKPKYEADVETAKLHISKSNSKMGKVHSFSKLSGNKPITLKDGTLLTNVYGSCKNACSGCENDCYDIKSTRYHHNAVVVARVENLLLMREKMEECFQKLRDYLSTHKVTKFRIHQGGELESFRELYNYNKLAKEFPNIQFCIYTKRFEYIDLIIASGKLSDNFVINASEWQGNISDKRKQLWGDKVNYFAYDDHHPEFNYSNEAHCPAVNPNGTRTKTTCQKCGRCYRHSGFTAVYAH